MATSGGEVATTCEDGELFVDVLMAGGISPTAADEEGEGGRERADGVSDEQNTNV